MLQQIRAAITANGGTPQSFTEIGALRELVAAYGGTPTKWSRNQLLQEAIVAAGGTPTTFTTNQLLAELVTTLGGSPSFGRSDLLDFIAITPAFSIADLFANDEQGAWYDPSDLSSMWQDSAGTTPAVVDSPVGRINDKSGNGNHATQATSAKRPILRESGGLRYLQFNGTATAAGGTCLTVALNMTTTDKVSLFAGVRKLVDTFGVIAEHGNNSFTDTSAFGVHHSIGNVNNWRWYGRGSLGGEINVVRAAPNTAVLSASADISGDALTFRENGSGTSTAPDLGTGNFSSKTLFIGQRQAQFGALNGHLYGLVVRGALTTGEDFANTEAYIAGKTGVAL